MFQRHPVTIRRPRRHVFALAFLLYPACVACGSNDDSPIADSGGVDADGSEDVGAPRPLGPASVLQHHNHASRDGVFVDPTMTKAAAAGVHRDPAFRATVTGKVYGQPLFLEAGGPGGGDVLIVATHANNVYSFDAATGALVWQQSLGTPVPRSKMPCGNDPAELESYGVGSTPVVDTSSRTVYLSAYVTPDDGTTQTHLVFALSIDDGTIRPGWPVDPRTAVPDFNADHSQGQRGALALVDGILYVPFGGLFGDCGNFRGRVIAIPIDAPTSITAWATRDEGGGVWAPSGIASDGTSIFVATGNTVGATTFGDGESLVRLGKGGSYTATSKDFYAPTNWKALDDGDVDLGGSGALLVHVPGATPADMVAALGKDGNAYFADKNDLGGIGGQVILTRVSIGPIVQAATTYTTGMGTYVVFGWYGAACPTSTTGSLTALKLTTGSPASISTAWCGDQNGKGSPATSTTDGSAEAVVWGVGAEGDELLHAFDGDTGAVINDGTNSPAMSRVHRFQTPIVAKGRVYVAGETEIFAFMK